MTAPALTSLLDLMRRLMKAARSEISVLAALLVVALGVLGFAGTAEDMSEADGQAFDWRILRLLRPYADDPGRPWGPPWLKEAAQDLTSLGGISVLGLLAFIAVLFLILQRKRLSALLLVLGLAGGVAFSEGLKAVFERERPPTIYQAVETINASFPSGHALLSAVFYLTLGVMLTRAFAQKRLKAYALGVAVLLTLIVGLTRIYLGAHWASDVFAGWSVGAAWAMILWLVSWFIARRPPRAHSPLLDEAGID